MTYFHILSLGHIQANRITIETLNSVSVSKWKWQVPKDPGGAGTTGDAMNGTHLFANMKPTNPEVRIYYS